jgi:hypothetical protein
MGVQNGHLRRYNRVVPSSMLLLRGEEKMASLNLTVLASILVGGDPTEPHDIEAQFVRGEEISILRQMLLDTYGEQSDIAKALQAGNATALGAALGQANPPLDSNPEIVRIAQDLLA